MVVTSYSLFMFPAYMRWLPALANVNAEITEVVSGSWHHIVQPPRRETPFMVGFQLSQMTAPPGCM